MRPPTQLLAASLIGATVTLVMASTAAQRPAGSATAGAPARVADTAATDREWRFAGQLGGGVGDVAMLDRYALLGVGPRIAVFDISTPEKPRWAATGPVLGGTVRGIAVEGGRGFVAAEGGGLAVLDAADPLNLRLLGSVDLTDPSTGEPDRALDVQVKDGHAFVAAENAGLMVVDVRDPARPVVVGALEEVLPATNRRLAVIGSTVLLVGYGGWSGSGHSDLAVISVDDLARPMLLNQEETGDPRDIALMGGFALIPDSAGGLAVLDITNPHQPTTVARLQLGTALRSVEVDGRVAYVGDDAGTVHVVDMADATAPRFVRRVGEPQAKPVAVMAVAVRAGWVSAAFLSDTMTPAEPRVGLGLGGMKIIDAGIPASARVVARVRVPSAVLREVEAGVGNGDVWVIDAHHQGPNPDDLRDLPDDARNAVFLIDAADPARPRVRAGFQLPGAALPVALAVATPYLYVLAQMPERGTEIFVVDARDLDAPRINVVPGFEGPEIEGPDIISEHAGGIIKLAVVAESLLFQVNSPGGSPSDELNWLDLSDPANPRLPDPDRSSFPRQWDHMGARDLMAADPLAYGLSWEGNLTIFDFRDPTNPHLAAMRDMGYSASRGAVVGKTVLAAGDDGAIHLIDTSSWARFGELGQVAVDATGDALLAAQADRAFLLDDGGKLSVLDIARPASPALFQTVAPPAIAPPAFEIGFLARPLPIGIAATAGRVYGSIAGLGLMIYTETPRTEPPAPVRARAYLPLVQREHQRPPAVRPRKLEELGAWSSGEERVSVLGVAGDDRHAYAGTWSNDSCGGALHVIDVSQPSSPLEAGGVDLPFFPNTVQVVGGRAYVAGHTCEADGVFAVIDVTDASRPRFLGRLDLPRFAIDVALDGRWAYVLDGSYELLGPTWSANANHELPAAISQPGAGPSRADQPPGEGGLFLRVIDVADPRAPRQVGTVQLGDESSVFAGMAAAGGLALVADVYGGLRIVDVTNPALPRELATYPVPGAFDVAVDGGRAFVLGYQGEPERDPIGLWVLDLANPARPTQLGALVEVDSGDGDWERWLGGLRLAVADDVAYVGAGRWLRAIDLRDPAWPVLLDVAERPAIGVAAAGRRVYAVHEYRLSVFELVDR